MTEIADTTVDPALPRPVRLPFDDDYRERTPVNVVWEITLA
jgi:hypothetical protein